VRLRQLAAAVEGTRVSVAGTDRDPELTAVVHDTRAVRGGALFCCVRGSHTDGHDLAANAVERGAAALLVDHVLPLDAPQLVVDDVRPALGPVAAAFWGQPSRQLAVVGVTGTSGKTTVTHLLRAVLDAADRPCGVIGTLSGARTTPEAPELQAQLADQRRQGHVAVALEVSSHGLELHRVDATRFAVGVFTNLSQDHLDFHGTMEAYFAAKAQLFTPAFTDQAVICADDRWGERLLAQIGEQGGIELRPYRLADADDVRLSPGGTSFRWRGEWVDYSHKPDALDQALRAARELAAGKGELTVVFGCGGDRDTAKRPVMGEVAARLADRVVLTSDNPRSEDPLAIISDVHDGIPAGTPVVVEPDRRRAVDGAVDAGRPGDVIVIAGKGHETTQVIGDRAVPFDDRVVAREALAGHTSATKGNG
jgi:UDP-N-acetylmuramoyl-L-alanyl-D-glutamate--2,6-diaminopimelate ligase